MLLIMFGEQFPYMSSSRRFIIGLGVGLASLIVPLYLAELSPVSKPAPADRGSGVHVFCFFFVKKKKKKGS